MQSTEKRPIRQLLQGSKLGKPTDGNMNLISKETENARKECKQMTSALKSESYVIS
jgi:hypothetical protein